jgi:hypothetical protein
MILFMAKKRKEIRIKINTNSVVKENSYTKIRMLTKETTNKKVTITTTANSKKVNIKTKDLNKTDNVQPKANSRISTINHQVLMEIRVMDITDKNGIHMRRIIISNLIMEEIIINNNKDHQEILIITTQASMMVIKDLQADKKFKMLETPYNY